MPEARLAVHDPEIWNPSIAARDEGFSLSLCNVFFAMLMPPTFAP
jgi:hypothetical protein